jgi:hypothetical protein
MLFGVWGWTGLTNPTGEHVAFHKGFFELGHADAFFVHDVFCRSA